MRGWGIRREMNVFGGGGLDLGGDGGDMTVAQHREKIAQEQG